MSSNIIRHTLRLYPITTVVYNAAAPVAFQDLNISAVVGARVALVIIKVARTASTGAAAFWFKQKGETYINPGDPSGGYTKFANANTYHGMVYCFTDASGILQWKSDLADNTILTVMGYLI